MSDKLNCFECKNWFDVNELIYLPTEQYYLCHHDAATHYAIKCETLRAERDAAREAIRDAMEYLKETHPERVKYPEYIEFHVCNSLAIAVMPERVDGEK